MPPSSIPPAPWERQPGETLRAYSAFAFYRDRPPHKRGIRTANALYQEMQKAEGNEQSSKLRQWATWSSKYHWVDRVSAWDDHQDEIRRKKSEAEARKMAARHAREACELQEQALKALKARSLEDESKLRDVLAVYMEAAKLERLSRGEPTENIKLDWRKELERAGLDAEAILDEFAALAYRLMGQDDTA